MNNIKNVYLISILLLVFIACRNGVDQDPSATDDGEGSAATVNDSMDDNTGDHEAAGDYAWDSTQVIDIVLNEGSITVDGSGVAVEGSTVVINAAGDYRISGKLSNGQIRVDAGDDDLVRLILDNADLTCSSSAPVYILNAGKTIIILAENSRNYVKDGSTYIFDTPDTDEPNAAVFSKDDLTIYGTGSLTIDANYNYGIASKDGLLIKSGTVSIDAVDDGIRGKEYLIVRGGTVTIRSGGDGLKSDDDEDQTLGYVLVENGLLTITSGRDAITAQTDVLIRDGVLTLTSGGGSSRTVAYGTSAKGIKGLVQTIIDDGLFTINSADDAIHSNKSVVINDGVFTISTNDDAIHADASVVINGGELDITKCYEGIESASIVVNDGEISIVSSDDAFNATKGTRTEANDGSSFHINGGNITLNASRGDGLDSNGSGTITSGTVIVHGPQSQPEVGFDINGAFTISGGLLVATGPNSGHMIEVPSTNSAQYSIKVTFSTLLSTSSLFHIQDENGNDIVTFKPVRRAYYLVFSSPALTQGSTYYIYTGGSTTGTDMNGLFTGGEYSPGTLKRTVTISNKITSVSI